VILIGDVDAAAQATLCAGIATRGAEMPRCRDAEMPSGAGERCRSCARVSGITLIGFRAPSSGDDVQSRVQPVLRSPGGFTAGPQGNAVACGEKSRKQ
jgi:hypothetical protein